MEDALWDVDQDVTDVMVAADADHVQDLVVLLVLDVHRAPVVLVAQDVEDLALEIAIRHVQMDAHQGVLKTAADAEQVALEDAEEIALVPVEAIVQEDAVQDVPLVVEEVVQAVVHHVLDAMDLALVHVGLVALGNVEDVVITVLHHALLTVVLLVLEHAMVVFQIQFNKIVY